MKPKLTFYYIPTRMAKTKIEIIYVGENVEQHEFCIVYGSMNWKTGKYKFGKL